MKIVRKMLKWFVGIIILLILTAVILVRFTDGSINTPENVIFGYDEKELKVLLIKEGVFKYGKRRHSILMVLMVHI